MPAERLSAANAFPRPIPFNHRETKMIDLHMHSSCSDGTLPPEELVAAARILHTMGEKKLPAMFANTMSRLPKTPQTTAAASTINVLFAGFPQKN